MPITTTPSGGPQGEFSTYTPIYSQTLSGATSSITFSNIPTTFTDLSISLEVQLASTGEDVYVRFNGDSGSNYSSTWLRAISNTASSLRQSSTGCRLSDGGSSTTGNTTQQTINIQNYSNTTTFKTTLSRANNASRGLDTFVNLWRSTSPITSLTFYTSAGNISSGTITIYGIKAAATQFIPTKAAGGDIVVSDGTYAYHAFLSTGSFKPAQSLSCDVLVVAGGGSGAGNDIGGGGGAGGLRYFSAQSLTATTYAVTVGAGGAGAANNGSNGNDSQFGSLTLSTGGGKGGGTVGSVSGSSGGSGGGAGEASYQTGSGGAASPSGQGNAGGNSTGNAAGGGGGGAGAAGQASNAGCGGGAGVNTYSSWATATGTGSGGYYAGGGGGGNYNANSPGSGGLGGGGTGSYRGNGSPAAAYTGSGGGGSGGGGVLSGGSGGSGIVIVRYAL